jgi:NADPH-dependent ferric siderophore reductase
MARPDFMRERGGGEGGGRGRGGGGGRGGMGGMSEAEIERRRGKPWTLKVLKAFDITPNMRRVQLTGDNLDEFEPRPAQEIVLQLSDGSGEPARRHYTIRRYDRASKIIDVDFVLHGHRTPGVAWALDAKPGDLLDIRGPRGRIGIDSAADWYLFLGDETAIPAIFALIESLRAGVPAFAFIEIGGEPDKQKVETAAKLDLKFLSRNGATPGPNDILAKALAGSTLPSGNGQAFTLGETSNIRGLRHGLVERGMDRGQIYSEGYWRPDRIGGHDHVHD